MKFLVDEEKDTHYIRITFTELVKLVYTSYLGKAFSPHPRLACICCFIQIIKQNADKRRNYTQKKSRLHYLQ